MDNVVLFHWGFVTACISTKYLNMNIIMTPAQNCDHEIDYENKHFLNRTCVKY